MTKMTWDASGERRYQTGIDQGVLYVGGAGTPWNGLISVTENPSGGDAEAYFLDGQKVLNISTGEDYNATVETFAFPDEFAPCAGRIQLAAGLFASDQPKALFDFSYRTLVGDDLGGPRANYKIHLVYGALAQLQDFTYGTLTDDVSAKSYSFDLTAIPVVIPGYRPTAHFVFDSRIIKNATMGQLSSILYGSDTQDPRSPTVDDLITLLSA